MAARVATTLAANHFDVKTTTDPVETLNELDADAIVVIGGDGTLRGVVEHLGALVGLSNLPPVLPIGLGTANLMQRHLGLQYRTPHVARQVLELLQQRRTRELDVGVVNGKLFLLMAGCGFDAAVVQSLAKRRTGPIRKWSYVSPAVRELLTVSFPTLSIEVDGQRVLDDRAAQVLVGNVAEYGTGFPIATDADSGDGLLDVCIMPCESLLQVATWQINIVRKKHVVWPGAIYLKARAVRIFGPTPIPLQVDGDAAGFTPADIRLLDERVRFIVA